MINKGIFFDLYGTLFIFGDMNAAWNDWAEAYYKCVIDYGNNIEEQRFKSSLDGFFSRPKPNLPRNGNESLTIYEHRIKEQCDSLDLLYDNSLLQIIAAATTTDWQKHIRLDKDAIPLLKKLKEKFILALVSNFDHPPHIHSLFSQLELSSLFDEMIISGEIGIDKPDPRIFQAALTKTGLASGNVWFVGDSIEDIEGSKSAGLKPVLINRKRELNDHVIVDFHSDPGNSDKIQKQPDKNGIIEIDQLTDLLEITNMD